ncbi:hypothetical protein LR48_Vigan04g114300 [Vigna angularis]|uniref:Uncharacterized protein n=1 Tax=Phaseolus angularis TaxID=3914 RepID=A0A0L9UDH0_PHAAN|nr:hypothetical protein LR48_Vigan04g114300 [Vigna angularis]
MVAVDWYGVGRPLVRAEHPGCEAVRAERPPSALGLTSMLLSLFLIVFVVPDVHFGRSLGCFGGFEPVWNCSLSCTFMYEAWVVGKNMVVNYNDVFEYELDISGSTSVEKGGNGFCTCGSEVVAAKSMREVKLRASGVARRPRCYKSYEDGFKVYKGSLQEVVLGVLNLSGTVRDGFKAIFFV